MIDLPMEMQSHDRQTFASEEPRLTSLGMFQDYAEQKWWCSQMFTAGCAGASRSCHRLV